MWTFEMEILLTRFRNGTIFDLSADIQLNSQLAKTSMCQSRIFWILGASNGVWYGKYKLSWGHSHWTFALIRRNQLLFHLLWLMIVRALCRLIKVLTDLRFGCSYSLINRASCPLAHRWAETWRRYKFHCQSRNCQKLSLTSHLADLCCYSSMQIDSDCLSTFFSQLAFRHFLGGKLDHGRHQHRG